MINSSRPRERAAEAGAAFVELVVALPVLFLLLIGTADFARVFYMSIELTNASRAGAQYGAYSLARSTNTAMMQATAIAAAPNIGGISATASRLCQCADDAGNFSPLAGGTTCNTDPPTSCPGLHRVMTVTLNTSGTFRTIAAYAGIPGVLPLSRTATLRVSEE